ncbi:hypothetical protein, partial [Micromonospora sp. 4G55]|uniref:hypothetical protein n=1 Tax=Micromonospora sp. 4G55 TaxID=2806102 RepID=UPI001A6243FC
MAEPHFEVLRQLLQQQGYALALQKLGEACAHHPEQVCALLSQAGTIAATHAQITALTDAANLLSEVHTSAGADTVPSLRERLDQIADTLTTALAQHDKATAALRHTCQSLLHTDIPLLTTCRDDSPAALPARRRHRTDALTRTTRRPPPPQH